MKENEEILEEELAEDIVKEEEIEREEDEKDLEIKELKDRYLRLQADFVNYKNRVEREKQNIYTYGNKDLF